MFYLYVKTHNKTGLKYLGQTSNLDPFKYKGSGLRWKHHLKKHGNDVVTEILAVCETKQELRKLGVHYSNLWNVATDKTWANIIAESGEGVIHTPTTKAKISKGNTGKVRSKQTRELIGSYHRNKIETLETRKRKSLARVGKFHSNETKTKMSLNSGQLEPITIEDTTYPSRKAAWLAIFPEVCYETALARLRKLI